MNFGTGIKFELLSKEQIMDKQLNIISTIGAKAAVTDFAILLGSCVSDDEYIGDVKGLKNRTSWYYIKSSDGDGDIETVSANGYVRWSLAGRRSGGIRPVWKYSHYLDLISKYGIMSAEKLGDEQYKFEYGEYPQYAVESRLGRRLDILLQDGILKETGKTYTTDSQRWDANGLSLKPIKHVEYEYEGKKYVRVHSNCYEKGYILSNSMQVYPDYDIWVEVSPITWYVDTVNKVVISKNLLASGVRFCNDGNYYGDFEQTEMYKFLNQYFARDIIPQDSHEMSPEAKEKYEEILKQREKIRNPYGFNYEKVSEEEIIKGVVESGVAVYLHGESAEGKSSRVKQIDPTCEIIYLNIATPETFSGKSVYDSQSGEMKEIKPSWLTRLEEKCAREPERNHILFMDELTNALPSIQGKVFNIVLDREVNGLWKLPDNARIVAAGNEMEESLAANKMVESLFKRFAHVYIKTTTENWLKWASENNIHPAIYSYIAYKNGETLRSKYDGKKPNADPRKWEMASRVLYRTGQPEMLRALVGEDITNEFVQFCNQSVITLEDVLNKNYSEEDIKYLNTAERYATAMSLSQVGEEKVEEVRKFVELLGAEYVAVFDGIWTHGDEKRLEKIAEIKLGEQNEGSIKKR